MIRIGFLGPAGTFSQEAVRVYTKGAPEFIECAYTTVSDVILAVKSGEVDEGMIPVENSLEGAVNETLDIMSEEGEVLIKAEVIIPIRQHLLVKRGIQKHQISKVISHPQAIGQCRKFLKSFLSDANIGLVNSTAEAAKMVAESDGSIAAVGAAAAAGEYELDILQKDIQDRKNNYTRFIIVSLNAETQKTGNDKTSIVFSTEDKPGSLYRILDIFNLWDINMTRIESRPAKKQLGQYIFFIDIEGHIQDRDVSDALTMVKRKTSYYKYLGSYPVYKIEN